MGDIDLLSKLRTSWTKYDAVQVINMVSKNEISKYIDKSKPIDEAILRSFLGIKKIDDELPKYWIEIQKYPDQIKLFSLIVALFTHHVNIKEFSDEYSSGNMEGVFVTQEGIKQYTNLRSALVESGAAEPTYRRRKNVPYNFSKLYVNGEVGSLFKEVLKERLMRVGYANIENDAEFYAISFSHNFHRTLSLTKEQLKNWLEGNSLTTNTQDVDISWLSNYATLTECYGIPVRQWLDEWDKVKISDDKRRREPPKNFILFKLPARVLKRLSTVHRRETTDRRADDVAIQRQHTSERSIEISRYILGGYPWSVLTEKKRNSSEYDDLRMPGWLPTAIIANIVAPNSVTKNDIMKEEDCVKVGGEENGIIKLSLPNNWNTPDWNPSHLPVEIIDGQHRLLAFDNVDTLEGDFEVPIVAFFNLDITWQAYLFYTINIKPKRINKSLAYDLYPLLRIQEWLDKETDSTEVYRETRAQELTETLWMHPESPWRDRINMLGDKSEGTITQASFLRSITSSYVKKWEQQTTSIGGLFGAKLNQNVEEVLDWSRTQQSAFLIFIWISLENSIKHSKELWAEDIRKQFKEQYELFDENSDQDPALISKYSLLATDQGVRGFLQVTNDICYVGSSKIGILDLNWEEFSFREEEEIKVENISLALKFLKNNKIEKFINKLTEELTKFDWRASSTPGLLDDVKRKQMVFRGSGGYKQMRQQLLNTLCDSEEKQIKDLATKVKSYLDF